MSPALQALVIAVATFIASSAGYWGYLLKKREKTDSEFTNITNLLMGMASIKIIQLGMDYIERGYITKDEYDDLRRYLYEPYTELGGNGTADRIMVAVQRLPLKADKLVTYGAISAWRDMPLREDESPPKDPYEGEERRGKRRLDDPEDNW